MSGGIASGTSLVLEGRIATGAGVFVICSQGERLAAALEAAVARVACGIISFRVAGGVLGQAPGRRAAASRNGTHPVPGLISGLPVGRRR